MLKSDWKSVVKKAWSIRLILLAGFLTGLEAVIPLLPQNVFPDGVLPWVTLVVIGGAFVARITVQRNMND